MTTKETIAEDACVLYRQDSETGDVEILPKTVCEPAKADPEIHGKLLKMAEQLKKKGGKIRLIFEIEAS